METHHRVILHVDMDAFFAQVEVLDAPELRGFPLVIGGRPGDRAAVACASYEARALGIRAGMAISRAARLAPKAVFLPCRPSRYFELSGRIMKILLRTTERVEPASIDEAFIDAAGIARTLDEGDALAARLQDAILGELGITSSVGIGPNKKVARMASGLRKPAGRTVLTIDEFRERFAAEPAGVLHGVGPATARRLAAVGISTVADLGAAPVSDLRHLLGINGPVLGMAARGQDDSPVVPFGTAPDPRSLGHEYTLPRDETDRAEVLRIFLSLSNRIARDLHAEQWRGGTVHMMVRWGDRTSQSRQRRVAIPTSATRDLVRIAWDLFRGLDRGLPVRKVGVSVSGLVRSSSLQLVPGDLFAAAEASESGLRDGRDVRRIAGGTGGPG